MRSQRVPISELEQPCGRCNHQNAAHTGGAKNHGWAIYDPVWANASGWCLEQGCECLARGVGKLSTAEEQRIRALRDTTQATPTVNMPLGETAEAASSDLDFSAGPASVEMPAPVIAVAPAVEASLATRSGFPVWRCPPNGHPNDLLRAECRKCGAHRPCEFFDQALGRRCGVVPVRMFREGPLCGAHEPGARKTSRETSPAIRKEAA
jgi:hypothetical protein